MFTRTLRKIGLKGILICVNPFPQGAQGEEQDHFAPRPNTNLEVQ